MLRSELLGIDIASNNIKILLFEKKRKTYLINNIFLLPYPPEDPKHSKEKIIAALIRDTLKTNGIRTRQTYITYSEKDIYYQHNIFPDMKKEDLIEAIRWMYRDQLDFDADKAVIEYIITREFYEKDNKKLELFITIVSRESIENIAAIAEAAGLSLCLLSFTPFAYQELNSRLGKEQDESLLWIELESKFAVLNIIKNKQIAFARIIKYTSDEFASVLNEPTLIDKLFSLTKLNKLYADFQNISTDLDLEIKKRAEDKTISFILIAITILFFIAGTALSLMGHRVILSLVSYFIAILISSLYTLIKLYPKNNIIFYPKLKQLLRTKKDRMNNLKKHTSICGLTKQPGPEEIERINCEINQALDIVGELKTSLLMSGGTAEILVMELVRSVSYYREKFGLEHIDRVILSGCAAEIIGMDDYIEKELGIKVEKIKLLDYFQTTIKQTNILEKNNDYLVKLAGLITLNPTKTINFLPLRIKEKTTFLKLITPTLALIAVLYIFLLSIWGIVDRNYKTTWKINDFKQNQLIELLPVKTRILKHKMTQDSAGQHILIVQQVINNNLKYSRFLFEISQAMPDTIALDEISLLSTTTTPQDAGAAFIKITGKITGEALAATELSDFISNLKNSPAVAKIDLGYIKENETADYSYKTFEIRCKLKE